MANFKYLRTVVLIAYATGIFCAGDAATSRSEEKTSERDGAAMAASPGSVRIFKDQFEGIEFVFIKGGCYEMGDSFEEAAQGVDLNKQGGKKDELPSHTVCIDDFYLGVYEVTQGQWEKVMGNNPSQSRKGSDYPVEQVSWEDAQQFLLKLNAQTGRKYRLPTEAEWEYAARSAGKKERFAGTSEGGELKEYAWFAQNSDLRTHPVGQRKPNGAGLYDMIGNVAEWCADWYDENYYKMTPKNNPQGPESGTYRVLRGNSYLSYLWFMRASNRGKGSPSMRISFNGFRVALSAQ